MILIYILLFYYQCYLNYNIKLHMLLIFGCKLNMCFYLNLLCSFLLKYLWIYIYKVENKNSWKFIKLRQLCVKFVNYVSTMSTMCQLCVKPQPLPHPQLTSRYLNSILDSNINAKLASNVEDKQFLSYFLMLCFPFWKTK